MSVWGAVSAFVYHGMVGMSKHRALAKRTSEEIMNDDYQYEVRTDYDWNWDKQGKISPDMGTRTVVLVSTPTKEKVQALTNHITTLDVFKNVYQIFYQPNSEASEQLAEKIAGSGSIECTVDDNLIRHMIDDPNSPYASAEATTRTHQVAMKSYEERFRSYFFRAYSKSDETLVVVCPATFVAYAFARLLQLPDHVNNHVLVRRNSVSQFTIKPDGSTKVVTVGDTCYRKWNSMQMDV